jgi:RND family efflux transporter MFP subunit
MGWTIVSDIGTTAVSAGRRTTVVEMAAPQGAYTSARTRLPVDDDVGSASIGLASGLPAGSRIILMRVRFPTGLARFACGVHKPWLCVLAGMLFMLSAACKGSASSPATNPAPAGRSGAGRGAPRDVQIIPAVEDRLVRAITVTGTLAAEEQVILSLKVTGRLNELYVDLGSPVTRGQVIARLVPTDFTLRVSAAEAALQQARVRLGLSPQGTDNQVDIEQTSVVRQARAVLDEAKLTRDRAATFVERGIAARADLDAAEAALKVADGRYQDSLEEVRNRQALLEQRRTELELARQALRDSSLTSPLDGIVRERHATAGQYLAVGSPVATIVRMHPLRLRAAVPEREAPSVRLDQVVRVTVEGDATVHQGRVVRVSPAIDEASRTLMVEAEVPNPRNALRPGSFANAEIVIAAQEKAVLVPASSLVTFAGVDKILVVKESKVSERRVTTGRRENGRIEIIAGLTPGEPVIERPGNLVEGDAVRIVGRVAGTQGPTPATK